MISEPAEVGDASVGDDQPNIGVAVDERREVIADRGEATTAVDQDRDVALDRERKDGIEPLVADGKLLRARMKLDPAGAQVETADRLLDRPFLEVEPHERDDPVGVRSRVGERAVVGRREGRDAVGLVEAERERSADPELFEHREHLVGSPTHPVDVVAEVRVRVEEHGSFRDIGEGALGDFFENQVCAGESIHDLESTGAPAPRTAQWRLG